LGACGFPQPKDIGGGSDDSGVPGDGDGGGDGDDAGSDASVDAPRNCLLTQSTIGALSLGQASMPAAGNWFVINQGEKSFRIAAAFEQGPPQDALVIDVVRPAAGFATNQAYVFETNPNAATYVAMSYLLADVDQQSMAAMTYWASSGSVTFTAIGENANQNITGSVTAVNYREINPQTAQDVPGGCTASIAGVMLYLLQNQPSLTAGDGPFTQAQLKAIDARITAIQAARGE
jgi:hypothetical protein